MKKITVHMIGNAHIDPVWLWRWREGRKEVLATCRTAVKMLKNYKDFTFVRSSAVTFKWIEETDKKLFEEIKTFINEGRMSVVGGWWVQPDCNLPSGESFIRQALFGKKYFRKKFGIDVKCGYNVDSFGHNGNLPQILKKCGLDYYVFFRPNPDEKKLPSGVFLWEGIDGTKVLACRPPLHYGYSGKVKEDIRKRITEAAGKTDENLRDVMCFYGVGDHGGGPTRENIEEIINFKPNKNITIEFSNPENFFNRIEEYKKGCPVVKGELQHHARGCYSVVARIKELNRICENELRTAEKLSVLSEIAAKRKYEIEKFTCHWQKLLFNQFHDVLAGAAIIEAYKDSCRDYNAILKFCESVKEEAVKLIVKSNSAGHGKGILLFNPHSFDFKGIVEMEYFIKKKGNALIFEDSESKRIFSVVPKLKKIKDGFIGKLKFETEIPAGGFNFYKQKGEIFDVRTSVRTGKILKNPNFELEVNDNGYLTKIFDIKNNVNILKAPGFIPVVLNDESDTWSHGIDRYEEMTGRFKAYSIKQVNNAIYNSFEIKSKYQNSKIISEIITYQNFNFIDFIITVYWKERRKMLRFEFPTVLENVKSYTEIPYGVIERIPDGNEEPVQRWIAASGDLFLQDNIKKFLTIAIINNCRQSYSIDGPNVKLTAIRSPKYAEHIDGFIHPINPQPFTDQGIHRIHYRIVISSEEWQNMNLYKIADEFVEPPVRFYPKMVEKDKLNVALFKLKPSSVILTVIKKSENESGYILRIVETSGKSAEAHLEFPLLEINHKFKINPFEIKTFHAELFGKKSVIKEVNLIEI